MTQQRILQLSDMDSPRRARRKAIIEISAIVSLGLSASWLAVDAIEWASMWLGRM